MTYAQRQEDDLLVTLLPEQGRYLEIGAYDGKTFSNTRLFAERGWEGVCVEPAAHAFSHMVSDPPPNAILVNALVGPVTGLAAFHYSKDAVSTTSDSHARRWGSLVAYTSVWTVSVSISDLLETFPGPYDLISIDTEGTTLDILDDLLPCLGDLDTSCVVYEHEGTTREIPGFREIRRTEENAICLKS